MDLAAIGVGSKGTFPQPCPRSVPKLLKEPTYMDPSHELSCTVNVTEAGRQARAELRIMEKERRTQLPWVNKINETKHDQNIFMSGHLVSGLRFLATDLNNGLSFTV